MWETWLQSLDWEDPLEKEPTPVFLPGKSPGQRNLAGCGPWGCKRVRHDLATKRQQALLLSSFYKWGKWGTERQHLWLTVPRQVRRGQGSERSLTPEPMLLTLTVTKMEHAGNSQIWRWKAFTICSSYSQSGCRQELVLMAHLRCPSLSSVVHPKGGQDAGFRMWAHTVCPTSAWPQGGPSSPG